MRDLNYSRIIVQFRLVLLYGLVAVWGLERGYRWVAAIAFVVYMLTGSLVTRRLPPLTTNPQTIQGVRLWATSSHRGLARFQVFGMLLMTLLLVAARFKISGAPRWVAALALVIGWFWVFVHFRMAKKFDPGTKAGKMESQAPS